MSKLDELLGHGRLQHLQMIANHTANLRMMVEVGPLVQLMDAFKDKIRAAQLGLCTYELELRGLETGRDNDEITQILKQRTALLQDLEDAARAAAKVSGELAKKVKNATSALKEQVVEIDKSLHHIVEYLEALKGNVTETASVAVTALVAPLAALRKLALELKEEGRTAAGMTFDWRLIRQFVVIALASGIVFAALFAVIRPDLPSDYIVMPNGGLVAVVVNLIAVVSLVTSGLMSGVFGCLALPTNIWLQWRVTRQAAAMITSRRLPESDEARAREADNNLELAARVDSYLSTEPAQAAA